MIAVHMIKRWHVFLDLLKFLLFFFSGYCVVTFATDVPKMWEVHTAMEDLFVDEEFEGASYVLDPSYYTLYTPFRAVHTPMYTRDACIYIIYTPNAPLNALYTP